MVEVEESWYMSGGGINAPKSANAHKAQFLWGNIYIESKGKTRFFKTWK